jgi:hypothetical protein
MPKQPPILEYASPPKSNEVPLTIRPDIVASLAIIMTVISVLMPMDIGSGRTIVNPLRVAAGGLTVVLVMVHAFMRLWEDRADGVFRACVFAACIVIATGAFAYAHWCAWGERKPRFSLQKDYWRALLVFACTIIAAIMFDLLRRVFQSRKHADST